MRLHQLLAVPLLVAALAGCGGTAAGDDGIASAEGDTSGTPTPSSNPSSGASMDPEERALKFAQCMRENGVPMEDPVAGKPRTLKVDRGDKKFQAALEKCRQYSPFGEGGETLSPEELQKMLEFTKCMREHGIDMPDPDPNSGPGIKFGPDSKVNPEDPKFQAAMESCRQYMPQRQDGKGTAK